MDYNPKMPSPFISNSFDQKDNKLINNNNQEAGNPETYCPTAPKYNSSNIARPENTNTSLLNLSSVLVASYKCIEPSITSNAENPINWPNTFMENRNHHEKSIAYEANAIGDYFSKELENSTKEINSNEIVHHGAYGATETESGNPENVQNQKDELKSRSSIVSAQPENSNYSVNMES